VYAVLVERGLTDTSIGKLVMSATFQFSLLVTVVVLSAVVPTAIAERWFLPDAERERRVDRRLAYAKAGEYV
jgi:Na+/citrate or Na+/malate symporter